jgi:hypothetical protein
VLFARLDGVPLGVTLKDLIFEGVIICCWCLLEGVMLLAAAPPAKAFLAFSKSLLLFSVTARSAVVSTTCCF